MILTRKKSGECTQARHRSPVLPPLHMKARATSHHRSSLIMSDSPPRISLAAATAIVIASMVGTGVFTSLGFQIAGIPSGFPVLLLWVVGGIVALCGGL